jgi:hypothetical protein
VSPTKLQPTYQNDTAGKPLQEVESAGSRSPGWRSQARKCLELRYVVRRIARNVA